MILVDAAPGDGPRRHTQPDEEVFVTLAGEATVIADEQEAHVGSGDIVIVPPDMVHSFMSTGSLPPQQIDTTSA